MKIIKAVVGILHNQQKQILATKRLPEQFMGGFWEFPGGKIDLGETAESAVIRELKEELGIVVGKTSLRRTMIVDYADRQVQLSVYNIDDYQGIPASMEGQKIAWEYMQKLRHYRLLPNMLALINAMTLPDKYWITPDKNHDSQAWMTQFNKKLSENIRLIQLRSKTLIAPDFMQILHQQCQKNKTKLLLNTIDKTFDEPYCDGWHLTSYELMSLHNRPCTKDKLLGASTHNLTEARQAQMITADFIVISPVQPTKTHPDTPPLGWISAAEVANQVNIPVYFLGGMRDKDLPKALKLNAQGIAWQSG